MLIKFFVFALVGAIGTLVHYALLFLLVEFRAYNPVIASGYGALAGLFVNYILNFKFTFKSEQSHIQTFPKYALIATCGLGINIVMMALLSPHLYYLFAQILTTLIVLLWNFLANAFWTFKQHTRSPLLNTQKLLNTGLGLLLGILLIRLMTLGFYPLYDPSESRYAEMSRKMVELGNWVTPMFDYGIPFWGKPPLTIWITALSLSVGGINDFFARLPSFILGVAILWTIYHLSQKQQGSSKALSAAVILASSELFFVMSGTVAMDQCLTFGIVLALTSFWLALKDDKNLWGYVFFIGLSIGILAKGPITLVLSGITIGLWTLITGRWLDIWKRIPWFSGTLLLLVITIPWFLIAEQRTPGFLEYFLIGEHWKRFTESGWKGDLYGSGRGHMRGMIWIYWLAGGFPWVLIFVYKILNAAKHKKLGLLVQSNDSWRLFCLLWLLSPLMFFTVSANIIWTYVLPGLPGMALLLNEWLEISKKYRTFLALTVPIGFSILVIISHFPNVQFYSSQKVLVNAYQELANQNEYLIYYRNKPYSAEFYTQGENLLKISDESTLRLTLEDSSQHYYIFPKNDFEKISEDLKNRFVKIQSYGKFQLVHATKMLQP